MDDDRRSRFPAIIIAGIGLVLPVLYALSIGPYAWLVSRDYVSPADWFYVPLSWLAKSFPLCQSFLQWYLELFLN